MSRSDVREYMSGRKWGPRGCACQEKGKRLHVHTGINHVHTGTCMQMTRHTRTNACSVCMQHQPLHVLTPYPSSSNDGCNTLLKDWTTPYGSRSSNCC